VALLIAAGATFVAQGSSDEPEQLVQLMEGALQHRGFSVINILSPCAVVDRQSPARSSGGPGTVHIDPASHHAHDRMAALQLAALRDGKRRVGLLYREERGPSPGGAAKTAQRDGYDDLVGLERIMNGLKP
jgi:2-oxoglutarate ferredoxin oxidoreductase subunit beta